MHSLPYQQFVSPAFETQLEDELEVAAQLLEHPELEITKREGQATVHWVGPYGVAGAIRAGRGKKGLYIIYRAGQVVDSGKADVQDLATRLAQHFEYPVRHGENLAVYQVRLGFIRRASAVNLAEGTVTRSLAKRGLIPLRRKSLATGKRVRVPNTAPFASPGGVRLVHRGRIPKALGSLRRVGKGRRVQIVPKGAKSWEFVPPYLSSEAALEEALEMAAENLGQTTVGRASEAEFETAAFELEGEAFFGWPPGGLSAIARRFWSYWGRQLEVAKRGFLEQKYGCWCGKGNVCSTVTDSLDGCCRTHDAAYGAVGVGTAGGIDMWTIEGLKRTVPADQALVYCSSMAINDATPYGPAARTYQQGIVGIFGTRAAAGRAAAVLGL